MGKNPEQLADLLREAQMGSTGVADFDRWHQGSQPASTPTIPSLSAKISGFNRSPSGADLGTGPGSLNDFFSTGQIPAITARASAETPGSRVAGSNVVIPDLKSVPTKHEGSVKRTHKISKKGIAWILVPALVTTAAVLGGANYYSTSKKQAEEAVGELTPAISGACFDSGVLTAGIQATIKGFYKTAGSEQLNEVPVKVDPRIDTLAKVTTKTCVDQNGFISANNGKIIVDLSKMSETATFVTGKCPTDQTTMATVLHSCMFLLPSSIVVDGTKVPADVATVFNTYFHPTSEKKPDQAMLDTTTIKANAEMLDEITRTCNAGISGRESLKTDIKQRLMASSSRVTDSNISFTGVPVNVGAQYRTDKDIGPIIANPTLQLDSVDTTCNRIP